MYINVCAYALYKSNYYSNQTNALRQHTSRRIFTTPPPPPHSENRRSVRVCTVIIIIIIIKIKQSPKIKYQFIIRRSYFQLISLPGTRRFIISVLKTHVLAGARVRASVYVHTADTMQRR